MSPSLGRVALCSRCPVGPSGTVSLFTWAGGTGNVPFVGYMTPPVVVEFWLLLAHSCVGLTLRLAGCEDWSWPQCLSCCAGADHTKQNSLQQGLLPAKISLWIYCLWSQLDPLLMLSKAACWLWGLLGGTLVLVNGRHCLWLALSNLCGAKMWSMVCGCLCWAWVCMGMTKLCTKANFHQQWIWNRLAKAQVTLRSTCLCLLPGY